MKEKITLSLDQHENARHGEEIFPLQKYNKKMISSSYNGRML